MLILHKMGSLKTYLQNNIYQLGELSEWDLSFFNKDFSSSVLKHFGTH